MDKIKERIEYLLKTQFLTIKDLEIKAGLNEKTVWYFLRGKTQAPKIDTLVAISKALNCSLDELVFGKKDKIELESTKSIGLFQDSFNHVMEFLKVNNVFLCADDVLNIVLELYSYCVKEESEKVDEKFADYLLRKNFL